MVPRESTRLPMTAKEIKATAYCIIDFKTHGTDTEREIVYNDGVIMERFSTHHEYSPMSQADMAVWILHLSSKCLNLVKNRGGVYRTKALIKNGEKNGTIGFLNDDEHDNEIPSYEDLIENVKNLNHMISVIYEALK